MSYPDSIQYLYSIGNEMKSAKLGLDRISAVLKELGDPHRAYPVVHVAGTNGKGSTCAMIEAALRLAGLRTALYTSPHLVEPTERIQIAGQQVTQAQFTRAFEVVHELSQRLVADGQLDAHPSYFETLTIMAFWLFREEKVEIAVIEVGLGGRLDATNVVTPVLSVITPVDMDHQEWLGSTLTEIAIEKAGIIKPRVPVVSARQHREAEEVIDQRSRELGSKYYPVHAWRVSEVRIGPQGSSFRALGPVRLKIDCPLPGEHQIENALTAANALHHLGLREDQIEAGIRQARWPGRLEWVRPNVLLDGAHNVAGCAALAHFLRQQVYPKRIRLVFGAMKDKDVRPMLAELSPLAYELILTVPQSPRSRSGHDLRDHADHPLIRVTSTVPEALAAIQDLPPEEVAVISGSLYLVGEARALLCPQ